MLQRVRLLARFNRTVFFFCRKRGCRGGGYSHEKLREFKVLGTAFKFGRVANSLRPSERALR